MLTVSTSEILGSLAFALLVAVTTHAVCLLRTHRNKEHRFRGRYASACIGTGTFLGMLIANNINPGFIAVPVFGGMFGGWYVGRRMGLLETTHDPVLSELRHVMDPNNPYSPPGSSPPINGDERGEPNDSTERRSREFSNG